MTENEFEKLVLDLANEWRFKEQQIHIATILAAFAELQKERDLLREAMLAEEWVNVDGRCPWCKNFPAYDHAPDCLRQRALGVKE